MQEIIVYDSDGNSLTDLVQYDQDVYVYVNNPSITKTSRAQFFNEAINEALVVESEYNNGILKAKIPNRLLEQPYPIIGYIDVTKNGELKCLYRFKIRIHKKPKPSDFLYDEQDAISVAIDRYMMGLLEGAS